MIPLFVKKQEEGVHVRHRVRNAFSLWWLGMINNFHYTLVLAGSNDIAVGYGMKKYVALITWANVFFGIIAGIINAFVLQLLSYNIRVTATSLMAIMAILLVSFAWDIGGHNNIAAFTTMLIGVIFIGVSCNYGSSVFLGYMERMPSWQISSWSSGTGLSGVAASLIFLGLTSAGMSNTQIFLLSIVFVVIYWFMYFFGLKMPFCMLVSPSSATEENEVRNDPFRAVEEAEGSDYVCKGMVNWKGAPWTSIVPARSEVEPECLREMERMKRATTAGGGCETVVETGECGSADLGKWARWKRDVWPLVKEMHKFTLWNNMNLAVVYVAEYAVQFMVPFSFPCDQVKTDNSFWLKNSFVITQFCYQFGVLISRSSLLCIRVRRIWIMSVVQVINAIAWFMQAKLKYVSDPNDASREVKLAFVLFAWMVFVGLMGGASYVNVFYNILEETRAAQEYEVDEAMDFIASRRKSDSYTNAENANDKKREVGVVEGESKEAREATHYIETVWKEKRDLAMNIGSVYSSIGIALGSLLDLLFTLVVLKGDECT
ncbi:putative calcium channel protein [Trypanosoma rangeli]|uniref:Putative calcium channel protein n=1 Tax=Trypanosoma rangeli TaxID=5698 RepID=A0A3R7MV96_TRYRA|nr:putative calcium channel protein [Trypanosoma rangeli]RNE95870.1 putative calcium channel protein [Trypanosoma rangeli]|eukprot:RNE95870.1 putative calcium channel protein [Trypanosoma rangeli]